MKLRSWIRDVANLVGLLLYFFVATVAVAAGVVGIPSLMLYVAVRIVRFAWGA